MRAQLTGLLFPFLTSRGWWWPPARTHWIPGMRGEPSLCSLTDSWSPPHSWGFNEAASCSTVRACEHHSHPSCLLLVTLMSFHSRHWPQAQSQFCSSQFCSTRWQEQSGGGADLARTVPSVPALVVLSITFLFLRLHVEIWGSEYLNPGLIPLGYSQAGLVGAGLQRQAHVPWLEVRIHTFLPS